MCIPNLYIEQYASVLLSYLLHSYILNTFIRIFLSLINVHLEMYLAYARCCRSVYCFYPRHTNTYGDEFVSRGFGPKGLTHDQIKRIYISLYPQLIIFTETQYTRRTQRN